jgi:serine/threonine protein kinase
MKKRIRSGQYEFPKPEWTNVSSDCKDLIKGCLKTNPEERLTIDQVIGSKWVAVRLSDYLYETLVENYNKGQKRLEEIFLNKKKKLALYKT